MNTLSFLPSRSLWRLESQTHPFIEVFLPKRMLPILLLTMAATSGCDTQPPLKPQSQVQFQQNVDKKNQKTPQTASVFDHVPESQIQNMPMIFVTPEPDQLSDLNVATTRY